MARFYRVKRSFDKMAQTTSGAKRADHPELKGGKFAEAQRCTRDWLLSQDGRTHTPPSAAMLPEVNRPLASHFLNRLSHFRELGLKRPDVEVTSPVFGQNPFDLSSPSLQRIPSFADRGVGRAALRSWADARD
jgi:hypothetical protein